MRHTTLIAASVFVLALAACNDKTAGPATPDSAALAATTQTAVAAALAARDAEDAKIHSDAGPAVYFANLRDGETVTSPVRVVFGLYGMGIAPAGTDKEMTGHHHLLIDTELTPEELKSAIPNDAQHMHFGGGQTEVVLQLPAGLHTLQLVVGNKGHEQLTPPVMSKKITINVK
jgi:Domain of unknown function (DUF4399)